MNSVSTSASAQSRSVTPSLSELDRQMNFSVAGCQQIRQELSVIPAKSGPQITALRSEQGGNSVTRIRMIDGEFVSVRKADGRLNQSLTRGHSLKPVFGQAAAVFFRFMLLTAVVVWTTHSVVAGNPQEPESDAAASSTSKPAAPEAAAADSQPDSAETSADPPKAEDAGRPKNPFADAVAVPDGILDGGTEWLNTSHPLSMKDLRGKIVLLDFWTYCCINCMHVLPDLKYLEEKYSRELVVIGVHSAKFDNEKVSQNIRNAIQRYEIQHPVVNDSEMLIWRKFGTRAWPTLAVVDPEGKYIGSQSGEGNRELFDTVIGRLAEYHRANGTLNETPLVFDPESAKAAATPLRYPGKVLADSASQRLIISDSGHNRIVICDMNGKLQQIVGSGQPGHRDGSLDESQLNHPQGVCLVGDQLYIADTENHLLRVADLTDGTVRTLAGTGQQGHPGENVDQPLNAVALNSPWSVCHVDGTLYIAMAGPHQLWSHRIGTDRIAPYAGSGREDVINGSLSESAFAQPSELVASDDGKFLYVVDSEGSAVRQVSLDPNGKVSTIAGTSELPRGQSLFAFGDVDAIGPEARFQHPLGIAVHENTLYVADSYNHKIRSVDLAGGSVATLLGTGQPGTSLNPAQLDEPGGISLADAKLYVADTNNHRITVVSLQERTMTELVVEGLTIPDTAAGDPATASAREVPDAPDAVVVDEQAIHAGNELKVTVTLSIPEGYKRNDMAPVTWDVFLVDGSEIISADAIGVRQEAEVQGEKTQFLIPLTAAQGKSEILVRLSYGYCSADASVCRLASSAWRIPVDVTATSEVTELQLTAQQPVPDSTP